MELPNVVPIVHWPCWHCGVELMLQPSRKAMIIECPCCGASIPVPALIKDPVDWSTAKPPASDDR